MKVFLSWSGSASQKVACTFRDWLPLVLQYVKPYVSSEDIAKGIRWSINIAKELDSSTYGIICVTRDNVNAPWINFEAGALSKTYQVSKVSPFLFNFSSAAELDGPLVQFQSTLNTKHDIRKLLNSINSTANEDERLAASIFDKAFEKWWPQLEEGLKQIPCVEAEILESGDETALNRQSQEILKELLELTRAQEKLLRSPSLLIPKDYLIAAMAHPTPIVNLPFYDQICETLLKEFKRLARIIEDTQKDQHLDKATLREMKDWVTHAESLVLNFAHYYRR